MHTTVDCVQYGHVDVVNAMLSTDGIDVNKANKYGWTPLSIGAFMAIWML